MVRRRGSVSSNGSEPGQRPGGLQRQNSSGSMSERTFRDPSPNRRNLVDLRLEDAPPVPALPRGYISPPPVPAKSLRRPASVEPPERISSPPPRLGGRGVSLDRGPRMMPLRQDRGGKPSLPSLSTVGETNPSQNRDSVNFSRPMSPPNSPPNSPLSDRRQSPYVNEPGTVASSSSHIRTSGLRDGEADNIQYAMQEIANRPVKKKKKMVAKEVAQGSHFPRDSETGALIAANSKNPNQQLPSTSTPSPLDSTSHVSESDDAARTTPRRKKKKAAAPAQDRPSSALASDSDSRSERSFTPDRPRSFNPRAAGVLAKHPSVVREEREAEEMEEQMLPPKKTSNQASPDNDLVPGKGAAISLAPSNLHQHKRSESQPVASTATHSSALQNRRSEVSNGFLTDNERTSRHQSLSPTRAAHFSAQLVLQTPELEKHQPPARSVSPAKSALKHSSSSRGPSPQGAVPGSWNQRNGRAASEASDTASAISESSYTNTVAKKRAVRVSFDAEPALVGRAASPSATPDSPVLLSPQNKSGPSKRWSAASDDSRQGFDSDLSSIMQPTPTLPSFGSVRGQDTHNDPNAVNQARRNQENFVNNPNQLSASTDEIIGRIFAHDSQIKGRSPTSLGSSQQVFDNPIPPGVTSVEGTGAASDDEDDHFRDRSDGQSSSKGANTDLPTPLPSNTVPSIAIVPATPGIGTEDNDEYDWPEMPGRFPVSTDTLSHEQPSAPPAEEHHTTDPTPATAGIAEPEPAAVFALHEPGIPAIGHVAESLRTQIISHPEDEVDHSDESIYSDAAEDLSDIEGDGFGSINAIVERPAKVKPPITKPVASTSASLERPENKIPSTSKARPSVLNRNESEQSEPALEEGWDRAQEYWSGLSQTRKDQLERAAAPGALGRPLKETKPKLNKDKIAPRKAAQSPTSDYPPLPPWPDKQYREDIKRASSPKASSMKQSMRKAQPDNPSDIHMRSSMRNGVAGASKTLRNTKQYPNTSEPKTSLQKKTRPASAVAMVDYNKPSEPLVAKHSRAASATVSSKPLTPVPASPTKMTATPNKNLRRAKSDGSDSSSSFRRSRPRVSDTNQYTLKRSMRGGPTDDTPQSTSGKRASSFAARSPSPSGLPRRPISSAGPSMRSSMREPLGSNKQIRNKSPSRFGFSKTPKSKPGRSGFSSRFEDSSDEDDGPINRNSRFADSSDDEDLAPVRGIPRRIDEGDSTDLEDSSAEPSPAIPKARVKPSSRVTTKLERSALAAGSLSASPLPSTSPLASPGTTTKQANDPEKKKRSFFGGLGSKKRDESRIPPMGSDNPLTRPKAERVLSGSGPLAVSETSPVAASPKSPKLQRRNTPKRFTSDSWPLPEMPPKFGESRPNTSDGNGMQPTGNGNKAIRPDLGNRRSTVQGESLAAADKVALGKMGKKKRFPMLRKAFGLHD